MDKKRLASVGLLMVAVAILSIAIVRATSTGVTIGTGVIIGSATDTATMGGEYTFGSVVINATDFLLEKGTRPYQLLGFPYTYSDATGIIAIDASTGLTATLSIFYSASATAGGFYISAVGDGAIITSPAYDDMTGRLTLTGGGDVSVVGSNGVPSGKFIVEVGGAIYSDWSYTGSTATIAINNVPSGSAIVLDFELKGENDVDPPQKNDTVIPPIDNSTIPDSSDLFGYISNNTGAQYAIIIGVVACVIIAVRQATKKKGWSKKDTKPTQWKPKPAKGGWKKKGGAW